MVDAVDIPVVLVVTVVLGLCGSHIDRIVEVTVTGSLKPLGFSLAVIGSRGVTLGYSNWRFTKMDIKENIKPLAKAFGKTVFTALITFFSALVGVILGN